MPRLYVTKGVELRQITGVGCAVPSPPSPSEIVANNSDRRSPSSPARNKDRVGIDGIAHGRSPETVTLRWGAIRLKRDDHEISHPCPRLRNSSPTGPPLPDEKIMIPDQSSNSLLRSRTQRAEYAAAARSAGGFSV